MGAWGHTTFENDDALDWVYELEEASGTDVLVSALEGITDADYLEATEASAALAAAEVVAALDGRPAPSLPPEVEAWVKENQEPVDADLLMLARSAVERIARDSELQELWSESGDEAEWQESLEDLLQRLVAA